MEKCSDCHDTKTVMCEDCDGLGYRSEICDMNHHHDINCRSCDADGSVDCHCVFDNEEATA